jgi:transcriptional regulator with XRE-family HTH domain
MPRLTPTLPAGLERRLAAWGAELSGVRRAQGRSAGQVAVVAGITRKTLARVERGDPAVAIGIYVRVVDALGLARASLPGTSVGRESAGRSLAADATRAPPTRAALRRDPRSLDACSLAMQSTVRSASTRRFTRPSATTRRASAPKPRCCRTGGASGS